MLEVTTPQEDLAATGAASRPVLYDWRWMLRALWRRPLPILIAPAVLALFAVIYVLSRVDNYTAIAVVNVTDLRLSAGGQDTYFSESEFDPTFLATQIGIAASEPIARAVVDTLGLAQSGGGDAELALRSFRARLSVQRLGQSSLVAIAFTAGDPQQAATAANEVTKAYIAKLQADREEAVKAASSWLRDRLRESGPKAQVVAAATPPLDKSNMRGILIVAMAGVAGAAAGMAASLLLAFLDRSIRDPEQAYAASGAPCLGAIPKLDASPRSRSEASQAGRFNYARAASLLSEVERRPFSPMWQALRHAGVAARWLGSSRPATIGVTSALPGEGKSTVAANLALISAGSGKRVLLVDAQPYDPALSREFAQSAADGLCGLLAGTSDLPSLTLSEARSSVDFLPYGKPAERAAAANLLWSQAMQNLFAQASDYDLIVFDMPPLLATGEVRAAADLLDGFVLVVEWGKTTASEIEAALALAGPVRNRLIGTLLNKAGPTDNRMLSPEAAILARQSQLASRQAGA